MKQRFLVGKMNVPDEKEGGHDEVTMETLGEDSTFLFVNAVTSSSSLLLTCVIFCLSSWYVHREEPLALQVYPMWGTMSGQWLFQSCRGQQRSTPPLTFDFGGRLPSQFPSAASASRDWGGRWRQDRTESNLWCSSTNLSHLWAQARPQRIHRESLLSVRGTGFSFCLPP